MDIFGVFGNPIEHSLSPNIHAQFAQQVGLDISYDKILAPIDEFDKAAHDFIRSGAKGFNITVPFKLDAFKFATEHTEHAKTAGAVNTIRIDQDNYIGHNTDGIGLVNDLINNLELSLDNKTILILGAGGATQGILMPLLQKNPARVMIANRTASKATTLANDFSVYGKTCGFGLHQIKHDPVDIIINATSASLDGKMPEIASGCAKGAICYDLMYGTQTPFMQWAKNNNAKMVVDGLGMLVEQAAAAFEFWTGTMPKTKPVMDNLRS